MKTLSLLNTPLAITDYDDLVATLLNSYAKENVVLSVAFANTHLLTLRRYCRDFYNTTQTFDLFIPDGMPLVWCLNCLGAKMHDRVYGPTFMRKLFKSVPSAASHYFIGGTRELIDDLVTALRRLNPGFQMAGCYVGEVLADGRLGQNEEAALQEIQRLNPDFIWVGLGAPKQEYFTSRYKSRLKRGIILNVGYAFALNAGWDKDAPVFIQRWGLTWVYRLIQDPIRLCRRYVVYNFLFLFYLFFDSIKNALISRR